MFTDGSLLNSPKPITEHDLLLFDEPEYPTTPNHHASSFSVTSYEDTDGQFDSVVLPSPVRYAAQKLLFPQQQRSSAAIPTSRTPLFRGIRKPSTRHSSESEPQFRYTNDVLFGKINLNTRRNLHSIDENVNSINNINSGKRPTRLSSFFSALMEEDPDSTADEEDLLLLSPATEHSTIWNRLNCALFLGYMLTAAASTVPVILVPHMADEFYNENDANNTGFSARAASSAVLGTACGKLLNGPVGDVFGARRVSCCYSVMLSLSLLGLAFCRNASAASWACFFVEFFQSVQWPCIIVILAAHYRSEPMYEGGIYVTSLASRFGALLAIPVSSIMLRSTHWRAVARIAALGPLAGVFFMILFVGDSPGKMHDPQNPIDPSLLKYASSDRLHSSSWIRKCVRITSIIQSVLVINILPALRAVLKSGTFWIVAVAHTGGSMVASSYRILGTYFRDTSFGTLSTNRAGELAVFLLVGISLGLAVGGSAFTRASARNRKRIVSKLYMLTIAACYSLAFLAIPRVRLFLGSPGLVLALQISSVLAIGVGVAVQSSIIPGIVGNTFGRNKGLYAAYTDGIAYGLGSGVWRIVGNAVKEGNLQGGGWAYGWAAVALLVIMCALLMVEFMEHYFVFRGNRNRGAKGGYETMIFV